MQLSTRLKKVAGVVMVSVKAGLMKIVPALVGHMAAMQDTVSLFTVNDAINAYQSLTHGVTKLHMKDQLEVVHFLT